MNIIERIGFRTSSFNEWNLHDSLLGLAQSGFKAVELCLEHPDLNPGSIKFWNSGKLQDTLGELSLKPASISYHGKQADWKVKERMCLYGMKLASEMGIKIFVSGSHIDPDSFNDMVSFTRKMCRVAKDMEVFFAVEPEPGTVISGTPEMQSLMEKVQSASLKINLDIGHSYITSDNYLKDIHDWGNDIVQVHIEDIKNKIHKHLSPGKGDINFKSVFSVLDETGYNGFYIIDLFEIKINPVLYAKKSIRDLMGILHQHD